MAGGGSLGARALKRLGIPRPASIARPTMRHAENIEPPNRGSKSARRIDGGDRRHIIVRRPAAAPISYCARHVGIVHSAAAKNSCEESPLTSATSRVSEKPMA